MIHTNGDTIHGESALPRGARAACAHIVTYNFINTPPPPILSELLLVGIIFGQKG